MGLVERIRDLDLFKKTLDPVIALAIIALLDVFLFVIVGAWTVGGGETMLAGLTAKYVLGAKTLQRIPFWTLVFTPTWAYWKIYISLGMGFGAFVSAVLSKEFYWRVPRHLSEWLMITIGGLLMGVGIRLSFVCNVSTFFGLTPEMNLGGYLAVSGIVAGAWAGTWIYKTVMDR
ncbi:MAG: YeeE/YedE thiosulfate transporter family protein [Acidiferrobacteraceae bacterium]